MDKPKISFSNERLFVRPTGERDEGRYMDIRVATSQIAAAYTKVPDF